MNRIVVALSVVLSVLFVAVAAPVRAQATGAAAEIKTLGVSDVKVSPTLLASVNKSGKGGSLGRVAEAMDGQLIAAINATRKFKVVGRSDLDAILKEQGFAASGNVDGKDPAAAKSFKVKGINYLVVTSVDDFQDFVEQFNAPEIGESGTKRVIRLSCVAKIYDSTTGAILEAPNVQIGVKDIIRNSPNTVTDGNLSDALMLNAARQMSELIANRVADVVFPAKLIAVSGTSVSVNRGDGTSVAMGQVWDVFALGADMKDPDTGESLGREETKIGAIRISSVLPKFSKADVIEMVQGQTMAAGQIVRPRLAMAPAPGQH